MFVRTLIMNVKSGRAAELAALIEEKHLPILRMFAGFRDQISMLSPDGKQMVAMSFWDRAEQADVYKREGYARVLAATETFIDGPPVLSTYEVFYSTAYNIRARSAGA